MKHSKPPAVHQEFVRRFPGIGRAWDQVNEQGAAGPLDLRAQRLAKLAIAIGALREGAVSSAVRKASDAGVTRAEMEQLVALAASTIGFPASVAAWSWIRSAAGAAQAAGRGRSSAARAKTRPSSTRPR
jgi:alkylhydroperoxidase/carboxymuconolactone decarboxylase family protein YurZ